MEIPDFESGPATFETAISPRQQLIPSGSSECRFEWLHHDDARQLLADGQPRIADLANEIRLAGKQFDDLVFAEPEFAQPVLHFGRSAKLFDPHRHARLHAAQRAHVASLIGFNRSGPVHNHWTDIRPCDPFSLHTFCHLIAIFGCLANPEETTQNPAPEPQLSQWSD